MWRGRRGAKRKEVSADSCIIKEDAVGGLLEVSGGGGGHEGFQGRAVSMCAGRLGESTGSLGGRRGPCLKG